MREEIVTLTNLTKTFSRSIRAADGINLSVGKGEVFGFLGPNGAGKTTTIRLILGLLQPDAGTIRLSGVDLHEHRREALRHVGALVEGPAFYPYLTGLENLQVFAAYSGGVEKRRLHELIELVGLEGRESERVSGYSLGMKQRLGIAQALLTEPDLLILDEPTNGLDPYGVKDIRALIHRLSRELQTTLFISSHILSEVQQICDTVAVINQGRIVASGKVQELLQSNRQRYAIDGPRISELRNHLAARSDCEIIQEDPLKISLGRTAPEELLRDVVGAGHAITAYHPVLLSLEDFFFSATQQGGRL